MLDPLVSNVAGLGIHLALAIMYTWSVISNGVPDAWGWSQADECLPYAVSCLVICLVMVPAGHLQDQLGPRLVATIGGILVGCRHDHVEEELAVKRHSRSHCG